MFISKPICFDEQVTNGFLSECIPHIQESLFGLASVLSKAYHPPSQMSLFLSFVADLASKCLPENNSILHYTHLRCNNMIPNA
jgi:hypothetical protein